MRLHNGLSPNGVRVTIFLAEKEIEIPVIPVDILGGEPRREPFLSLNPLGEVPILELDDGTVLTESVAICRYLEALHPAPRLFGDDAKSQGVIEMWNRRIEMRVYGAIADFTRHEFELFKERGPQIAEFAAARRADFRAQLEWLDGELSRGQAFIAGERFTVADITGMAMLLLMGFAQYDLPSELEHLCRWADLVRSRPSFPPMPD